ncbi:MAG TPA: N-acetylglucosamine-specific PTS transporter subunit IIBC [Kofleriaceae bacterium]|nr:N-acetylglucosamine-specific PTS transporter subunit IIBC [Kofleriaceae bacterium]
MVKSSFAGAQKLGRALMLPIAVLPVAGLLLRLGQADMLDIPFVANAGDAVFKNLGLLFAVGVAIGFAKESHGAAGLAGAVGYFIATWGAKVLIDIPPDAVQGLSGKALELATAAAREDMVRRISVLTGILSGLLAGGLYNRYYDIKLPDYLAFFGGRRFVPIVTGFACVFLALALGYCWPIVQGGLDAASRSVLGSGEIGLFIYGVLNRLLLVTGLHHIVNNIAWVILGDYHGVTGDLNRFFAGDPSAGAFMAGFFPIMMFGLPGACLAMYRSARSNSRRMVAGILFSMALTSFLTGVTEPVEYAFMFLAPVLYVIHAILTGLSLVVMDLLHVKLGFTFSAGLFDYVISFKKASHPLLLLPVGAVYFLLYYGIFRFAIARFDLKTIGRESDAVSATDLPLARASSAASSRGESYLQALGGAGNVREVEACATRLRLDVVDSARIDEAALKQLGARGVLRLATGSAQVIIGPQADQVADEIQQAMRGRV